jgi:hypothetical protein
VWGDIAKAQAKGRTITLKLRLSDFTIHTHARTLDHVVSAREEFAAVARALLDDVLPLRQPARLMGLTLSGLEEKAAPAAPVAEGGRWPCSDRWRSDWLSGMARPPCRSAPPRRKTPPPSGRSSAR